MSTTITRSHWTDDTGTPASPAGNGTVINEARLQEIYNNIDALVGATISFGGLVHTEGTGTHQWVGSGNGRHSLHVKNSSGGTSAFSSFALGNDSVDLVADVLVYSSTVPTTGAVQAASRLAIIGNQPNGVVVAATNASGKVRLVSNNIEIASAHQISTECMAFSVSESANTMGASVNVCMNASASAPAILQSGEPGLSASLVVVGCNYHGSTTSASARMNTGIGASWFRMGDVTNVTALEFLACTAANVVTSVFFVDSTANGYSFLPTTDNVRKLGDATHRWSDVYATTLHTGDVEMQNGFSWTEHDKIEVKRGAMPRGVALVNPEGRLVAFIDEFGGLHVKQVHNDLDGMPWRITTAERRRELAA